MAQYQTLDTPDGPVDFPEEMSDAEIQAVLQGEYGVPEQATPYSDFLAGAAALPADAQDALVKGFQDFETSPTDDPTLGNPVTAGANIARPILKVAELVSNVGIDAWKSTWGQHPLINNAIVSRGVGAIKDSAIANWAMTALGEGYDQWVKFEEKNPVEAQLVKDAGVVSEVFTPKVVPKTLGIDARKLVAKGTAQEIAARKAGVAKLIRPETMVGEGITNEGTGPLRRTEYIPSDREDSIIEAMMIEPKVDPARSFTHNNQVIREASRDMNKQVTKELLKAGNPAINKAELLSDIQLMIDDMDQIPGYHSLSGDARKYASDYYLEVKGLLEKSGSRATQIMKVRQEFDRYVEQGAKVYDPNRESAKQVAARHIRDILNQSVKDASPGDIVHDLLNRQHQLLSGSDILRSKVAKEAANVFSRAYHTIRDIGHLPASPLALYATAGIAVGTGIAPLVGGGVGMGYAAYRAFKGMTRGKRKQEMGRLFKLMDKSGGDFAAERIYFIELMKALDSEEDANSGG